MTDLPAGQMTETERQYIYKTIKDLNIKSCIESGTWYGGGSTLSIVKALYKTGGVLHTFEEHTDFYLVAKNFYENSDYVKNIKLHNESIITGLKKFNDKFFSEVGLVLLDGGDESPNGHLKADLSLYLQDYNISENVQSFIYLEDKISVGTHLLLHDWLAVGGRGSFIKKYLEETNNKKFEIVNVIEESTGFAHLKKIK